LTAVRGVKADVLEQVTEAVTHEVAPYYVKVAYIFNGVWER
jgi:hypothetical protein